MAYLELPVRSDLPAYEYQIELEKKLYTFSFNWNDRLGAWIMDIFDLAGEPIIVGVQLLAGRPLLEQYIVEGLPPGSIFCLDTTGAGNDPSITTLGREVLLIYRESTTIDE